MYNYPDPMWRGFSQVLTHCHTEQVKNGWWHNPKTGEDLKATGNFNVGEKLALIHSEVSEALEAHRKNLMDDKLPHRKGIEVELADALIRIGDLGGALGLDIAGAVAEKLEYNAKRLDHKPEHRASAADGKQY
jgi:NTP pyrophosphatase (non-canonical NTP hydrolase)